VFRDESGKERRRARRQRGAAGELPGSWQFRGRRRKRRRWRAGQRQNRFSQCVESRQHRDRRDRPMIIRLVSRSGQRTTSCLVRGLTVGGALKTGGAAIVVGQPARALDKTQRSGWQPHHQQHHCHDCLERTHEVTHSSRAKGCKADVRTPSPYGPGSRLLVKGFHRRIRARSRPARYGGCGSVIFQQLLDQVAEPARALALTNSFLCPAGHNGRQRHSKLSQHREP
jgi:hypothetical protein